MKRSDPEIEAVGRFLPRNVDAQPRGFTTYGVALFRSILDAGCPNPETHSNFWGTLLYDEHGEGEDDLIYNDFSASSLGLAAGVCITCNETNRWGLLAHYGVTDISHDKPSGSPTTGEIPSNCQPMAVAISAQLCA